MSGLVPRDEVIEVELTTPPYAVRRRATRKGQPCGFCHKPVKTRDAVGLNMVLCHRDCATTYKQQADAHNVIARAWRLRYAGIEIAEPGDLLSL